MSDEQQKQDSFTIPRGWLTMGEAQALHVLAQGCDVVVEIGSFVGRSSVCIAKGLQRAGKGTLYCVDPFDASGGNPIYAKIREELGRPLLEVFTENIIKAGVADYVRACPGHSTNIARTWAQPVDMLFIDGDHRYDGVKADVEAWVPFLRPGGILTMHDVYFPGDPPDNGWEDGPGQVVNEVLPTLAKWEGTLRVDSLFCAKKAS